MIASTSFGAFSGTTAAPKPSASAGASPSPAAFASASAAPVSTPPLPAMSGTPRRGSLLDIQA